MYYFTGQSGLLRPYHRRRFLLEVLYSKPITDELFAFYSETKTKTSVQHEHDAICTKMFCVSKNPIIADVLRACCVNLPICQMSSNENIKLKMTTLAYF